MIPGGNYVVVNDMLDVNYVCIIISDPQNHRVCQLLQYVLNDYRSKKYKEIMHE